MRKLVQTIASLLLCVSLCTPSIAAQGRHSGSNGRSERTSQTRNRTEGSSRPSSGRHQGSSSRPTNGSHGTTSRPNTGTKPNTNNNNRPGNNHNNGTRPGNNNNNRPGNNHNNGNRPGNNNNNRPGNNHNNGNRPGNNNNNRPGNNHNNGNRPGNNNNNRPGNNHNNGNRPGNNNNNRPGGNLRPGIGNNRPAHRPTHLAPPSRPYRPIMHRPHYRPTPPPQWRPRRGLPVVRGILGLTFGTTLGLSLDYLYNSGYTVDGYANDVVYLRNVNALNYIWTDAALYYGTNGFDASSFYYASPYYDMGRYNSVYNTLVATYGAPISRNNGVATWFGGNNGYITLSFGASNVAGGALRYLTTLTFGL